MTCPPVYQKGFSMSATTMDLINDVDADTDTIRILAQLSELIDGEPDYFRHAIVLLAVIAAAAARIQTNMPGWPIRSATVTRGICDEPAQ
jgi:hypothetical protein